MNFIYFVALALCLFSVASCAKSTTPSPVSQDQINQYVNAAFEYSSMLGCNYTLVNGTLKYKLNLNKTSGDFLFNFTANISDASGYIYPINVYVNGTGNPQALFPIYTINFRGDLIPKFGYKFPNGKRYLSTNSSNLLALAALNNIQLGWPFYCSGFQSLSQNTTIVNYIDNVEPIQKDDHYEYVTLAKIRDGQQFCHSILISISNSYLNIAGIHFFVDCDETKVPVL